MGLFDVGRIDLNVYIQLPMRLPSRNATGMQTLHHQLIFNSSPHTASLHMLLLALQCEGPMLFANSS